MDTRYSVVAVRKIRVWSHDRETFIIQLPDGRRFQVCEIIVRKGRFDLYGRQETLQRRLGRDVLTGRFLPDKVLARSGCADVDDFPTMPCQVADEIKRCLSAFESEPDLTRSKVERNDNPDHGPYASGGSAAMMAG